jgi:hypothetical protein
MSGPGAVAMAKKKAKPKESADERVAVIVLKGSPEYREWLNGISQETLIPVSAIVRDALAKWAKHRGHSDPPEI